MKNILVIGTLKYVLSITKKDDEVVNSKLLFNSSAILASAALKGLERKPIIISSISNDVFGVGIQNYLKNAKLDTSRLILNKKKGTPYIVKVNNERVVDTTNISTKLTIDIAHKLEHFISKANGIIITSELEIDVLEEIKRIATKYGVYVAFIFNKNIELSKKFYNFLDILFISEKLADELEENDKDHKKILNKYYRMGVQKTIITSGLGPIYYKDSIRFLKMNMYKKYGKKFSNLGLHNFVAKFYDSMLNKIDVISALGLAQANAAIASTKGFASDVDCEMLYNTEMLKTTNL